MQVKAMYWIVFACSSSPCGPGTCMSTNPSGSTCVCPEGYSGDDCSIYNACSSSPCGPGTCMSTNPSEYTCVCPEGYLGDDCSTYNACSSSPCGPGTCMSTNPSEYTCVCPEGYLGDDCSTYNDQSTESPIEDIATSNSMIYIIAAAVTAALILLMIVVIIILLRKRRNLKDENETTDDIGLQTVLSTGKVAYQSTTYSSGRISYHAELAVDGDTSSDFSSGSCSRTAASAGATAFWYVDLGDTYSIDYVNVFPATQFAATLTGIEVRVTSFTNSILSSTNICGSIPSGHHFVNCNPSLIGRYVSLHNSNINEIIVCEVQVNGDNISPSVDCPADIGRGASISNQVTVTWNDPSVSDNIDTGLSATCTPPSGSLFHIGSTDVYCSARDMAFNSGSCTFTVSVFDTGNPQVTCPSNIEEDTGTDQTTVTWDDPSVSDNFDTGLSATCVPPSGSSFNIGSYSVTCTATDNAGREGECTFIVTVNDGRIPIVICPDDITMDTNTEGTTVTWDDPSVSNNVDTGLSATCTPPSGSLFNAGSTNVICTATDSAGNMGSCQFTVIINDSGGLIVTCPDNIEERTNIEQVTVTWDDPSVSDNVDNGLSATCTPASGSSFNIGSNGVKCTATDIAGNVGSCQFTVNIIIDDSDAPVVTCPDRAKNQFTVTWNDLLVSDNGLSPTCSPPSGSLFDAGSTDVTCTSTDIAGNTGSCEFTVSFDGREDTLSNTVSGYLIAVPLFSEEQEKG
ncbi:hyalin-like isoform X2 [Antedon mediterranea]|uniref:hyalin-like isoform X2 n=1 Tax=Antedon mediterranea TaxID=105859 RepID=UPI003AF6B059